MSQEIGHLAEAIAALRPDLEGALAEGQGKNVQFGLGDQVFDELHPRWSWC
jgi:hypothetical protein